MLPTYESEVVSVLVYSVPLYSQYLGWASLQPNPQSFVWGSSCEFAPLPHCLQGSMLPVGKLSKAECYQPHYQGNYLSGMVRLSLLCFSWKLPKVCNFLLALKFLILFFYLCISSKVRKMNTHPCSKIHSEYLKSFDSELQCCYFWSRSSSCDIYHMKHLNILNL